VAKLGCPRQAAECAVERLGVVRPHRGANVVVEFRANLI
jgi:hypothetical protein